MEAYQIMPDEELLSFQQVELVSPLREIISRPGVRVNCMMCGEEIINQREIVRYGLTLCRPCSGMSYYQLTAPPAVSIPVLEPLPGLSV